MINIFKFTKLRKGLFTSFLILFLGIPLILLISNTSQEFPGSLGFVILFFYIPACLANSLGFGSYFSRGGIGVAPNGISGLLITIIFYLVLAFLLSWVGNLKKDGKLNGKE
ncbi:MAG: hypothetical protein KJ887_05790 [Candidatus Omnitrophica bacterium]|nr:hypothetical protein [Candidatus Omnitrophota bacterium]MBU1048085.1 hypothetical protein [Candidatus Omnitrophota bacterium]MBU1631412.1 hypothetical protein [Candidatus Omnitrophota bacterium]MBU1889455.1 hypothetical protein [Candidatus Omnitrophota bacterium]